MLKLVASDIDGTLMPTGENHLHERLFPLIRRLQDCEVQFVACSGRQYSNLRKLFAPVADEIGYICENGSLTMWDGDVLACEEIDRQRGVALLRYILEQPNCEALLSTRRCCYVQPKREDYFDYIENFIGNTVEIVDDLCAVSEPFIKISLFHPGGIPKEILQKMQQFDTPYLTPVIGGVGWLDFLRENCDKGTALETLCRMRGIHPTECIAIGDNENDLSLLGRAGEVWAMRSGHPSLRGQANRVIEDAEDALEELIAQLESKKQP